MFWRQREDKGASCQPGAGARPWGMNRYLITLGICLVVLGVLWPLMMKLGLGRLPGDIVIEREGFRLYIPITTSILASLVLSAIIWWLGR